jgi:tetratricopeptide (TPR) repeat protein
MGYLGPPEETVYYPTGNLQRDRIVAFTTAMDCFDDLEAYVHGNDHTRIASKLAELAQALSDLGLHTHALTISGFALEIVEGQYAGAADTSRLDLASLLCLRANILCDLKREDESIEAAEKAVTLCKEHRDSQNVSVPDVVYALLNYAVLLCSFGLKDEGAAVAFELQGDVDGDARPDMRHISALCRLCLSITRSEADDDLALSTAEEAIELSRGSSDADSQMVLAGALLTKSNILSLTGQNEAACPVSAEAIALLRTLSIGRSLFSLFLAHALDTHAHHLSEANRKGESFSTLQDAVELWQNLRISAPGPTTRRLAWTLFHLAKFRTRGNDRNALNEEFRVAETAVTLFREVSPLDAPGLADALYLYADRMLELDNNREAATYAEESVQYFREACSDEPGKEKYAIDLIFSLSLASSCLACTERADDAFEYAKQAVQVQHERNSTADEQYDIHLRQLLVSVVFRATEMGKQGEALPWFQELNRLGGSEDMGELSLLGQYIG